MARVPCGAVHMGAGIGNSQAADIAANAGTDDPSNDGDVYVWQYETSDAADTEHVSNSSDAVYSNLPRADVADWTTGFVEPTNGEACLDPYDNQKPYTQAGLPCIPVRIAHPANVGNAASPGLSGTAVYDATYVRAEPVRTSPGANRADVGPSTAATNGVSAFPQASDSWPTLNTGVTDDGYNTGVEATYCVPKYATKNGGMKNPPADVVVRVLDNDIIAVQGDIPSCRQTSLFSSTALESVGGDTQLSNEWLVDQNCQNGDAGGLPGWPVVTSDVTSDPEFEEVSEESDAFVASGTAVYVGDALIPGDTQCDGGYTGVYCEIAPPSP